VRFRLSVPSLMRNVMRHSLAISAVCWLAVSGTISGCSNIPPEIDLARPSSDRFARSACLSFDVDGTHKAWTLLPVSPIPSDVVSSTLAEKRFEDLAERNRDKDSENDVFVRWFSATDSTFARCIYIYFGDDTPPSYGLLQFHKWHKKDDRWEAEDDEGNVPMFSRHRKAS
jgi:hypothetical protein